jgi:hypothetical protein
LAWKIGKKAVKGSWVFALITEIFVVTIVVGTYLSYLFHMPIEIGLLGVLIGSIIAIGVLGYVLLTALTRLKILGKL